MDGYRPDRLELIGAGICLVGVAVSICTPAYLIRALPPYPGTLGLRLEVVVFVEATAEEGPAATLRAVEVGELLLEASQVSWAPTA